MQNTVTHLLNFLACLKSMAIYALHELYRCCLLPSVLDADMCSADSGRDRPSPLLVPVPVMMSNGMMIKKELPVVEFGRWCSEMRAEKGELECGICLNRLEREHEVRVQPNCDHVFHRCCVDKWIDKGHGTCPLCRSKLVKMQCCETKDGEDPWRAERIAYLFGQD